MHFQNPFKSSSGGVTSSTSSALPRPNGKVNIVYFTNWAIYGRKYRPQDIPAEHVTHVLYSFANVRPETGEVYLTDKWADEDIHWEGDSWNDVGTNMYGCFKQLYLLKKKQRHLKVLLSIGGWTYSPNLAQAAATPSSRQTFADSCVKLVEDYGIDGIDIDWEYPKNDGEAKDYVELLRLVRKGLDELAAKKGEMANGYELTIAAPCGPSNYKQLRIKEMDKYLSFWNLMAYDYAGSWDSVSGHQARLYAPSSDGATGFSTDSAMRDYVAAGVAKDKLVMGMPLYGRSFMNTDGPGRPYQGVGQGSWEQGVYDYKALPQPGSQVHIDRQQVASYSYNPTTRELVSYDTVEVASLKADYINKNGYLGAMYWESSGDKPPHDPEAIVPAVARKLGRLDNRENHLNYPGSKFDNLRNGMQS
ncbi:glycoside hydrolase family 18 protein [Cystobasidium minutum MCA 4210]|uniref:glycoside hydrolase family 18 protein n=1 Tax=Cystobasidium minutum MCA 4210 TaxID=1397322 RepID=UPI0034CF5624|eukprot:jgi/Rhomi1/140501/e_gw1.2.138.1